MHFGTHQVFENRSTYTCILIMSKQPNDEFQIGFVQNLNQFLFEHTVECATYAAPYLSRQPWAFLPQSLINQLHRAEENCEPLANLADIFVGVQTSADNIYIMHYIKWKLRKTGMKNETNRRIQQIERRILYA